MKYQDGTNTVNGFTVGVMVGTPLKDALNSSDDGFDHLRTVERIGTVVQDADPKAVNPSPSE